MNVLATYLAVFGGAAAGAQVARGAVRGAARLGPGGHQGRPGRGGRRAGGAGGVGRPAAGRAGRGRSPLGGRPQPAPGQRRVGDRYRRAERAAAPPEVAGRGGPQRRLRGPAGRRSRPAPGGHPPMPLPRGTAAPAGGGGDLCRLLYLSATEAAPDYRYFLQRQGGPTGLTSTLAAYRAAGGEPGRRSGAWILARPQSAERNWRRAGPSAAPGGPWLGRACVVIVRQPLASGARAR